MYKIPASTLFLGKNLVFVPECHSTNSLALQLCQASAAAPEGTLVITDRQTAGRGQRGNVWEAEPGLNLTLSLVFKPAFLLAAEQHYLTMAVALGLYDYLTACLKQPVFIKWPNDILVADKKVCGILIENVLQGSAIRCAVAGIGLNVNQRTFASPQAGSLATLSGQSFSLPQVLEQLLEALEPRYLALRHGNRRLLRDDYHRVLLGMGQRRKFRSADEVFEGIITGVDEVGRLNIDREGMVKSYGLKEVSFVYDAS